MRPGVDFPGECVNSNLLPAYGTMHDRVGEFQGGIKPGRLPVQIKSRMLLPFHNSRLLQSLLAPGDSRG